MSYKKLNERLKKELLKKIEQIDIDVQGLESYHIVRNPYCVESQLVGTSDCFEYDENEEWQAQIQKMKTYIEEDGAGEYLKLSSEDWDNENDGDCTTLTNECINFLYTLEN